MVSNAAGRSNSWLANGTNLSASAVAAYSQNAMATAAAATSSVHDLEEAMNKHLPLPAAQTNANPDHHSTSSSSSLGYGHPASGLQKHRSTIQWIGAHNQHSVVGSELSASSLLRSLYPSRESVIRTNVYSSRSQYYDIQNALLTPPGGGGNTGAGGGPGEIYKDVFALSLLNHSKTPPDSSYGLTNCYSSSPLGIGMPANMVTAGNDAYAMTPPSSVSPQESYMSQFLDHLHADRATMMQQYCAGNGAARDAALAMPVRPQAYALPAAAHVGSQLAPYDYPMAAYPTSSYYPSNVGMATYNYMTGGGGGPAHYRDAMKNANSW